MLSSAVSDWFRLVASDVLVDACVKAAVLLAVTAIAAFLLRSASAAVRHRLWCLGFCGAILLPVLSLTLPQWRIPLLPEAEATDTSSAVDSEVNAHATTPIERGPIPDQSIPRDGRSNVATDSDLRPVAMNEHDRASPTAEPLVTQRNFTAEQEAHIAETAPLATRTRLIAGWIGGVVIVVLPFAIGLAANSWLLWQAERVRESKWTRMVGELAAKLGLARRVTLLETQESVVPMTWGVVRPVVLLPSESREWNDERRRFVLLHELAHVKRLDVLFQSIARLACALYWFNPLAWYALWRLRVERELACDDCVVAAGEKPSDYAIQLVQIARAYRPARFSVGVAMARSTKLEQRIVAILDRARSHLPVGKQLARTLLAVACVLVVGLSVVGLGERASSSAEESKEAARDAAETSLHRGIVVDGSGKPIANASVYVITSSRERITWFSEQAVAAETKTDEAGKFEIVVPAFAKMTLGDEYRMTNSSYLLAVVDGFGPDVYHEANAPNPDEQIKLTLVKDTIPLAGRVLDLEGRPLAGVQLRVRSIRTTTSDLDAWIAKARHNPKAIPDDFHMSNDTRRRVAYFPSYENIEVDGLPMFPPVTTDATGHFRISGLGPDRYISLELAGRGIAKEWISAVTRSMPTVPHPDGDPRSRSERCFGAKFDYTAEPAQVITGIVRDHDTKEPLVGTVVEVGQFGGSLLRVRRFISATTDEHGRYRIDGLPKQPDGARPIRLNVLPNAEQPYFRTDVAMSARTEGLDPVNFDIDLKRAAWAAGRLVDQKAGEPVPGHVSYYPFIENANAGEYSNFHSGRRSVGHYNWYRTRNDGTYRIPAITGRGVVVARAFAAEDYKIGVGAEKIGWKANPRDRLIYHLHGPELTNAVHEVNIDGDGINGQEVALVSLSRQRVRFLDPNGELLKHVRVGGRRPKSAMNVSDVFHQALPSQSHGVDVLGLETDGQRLMLFSQDDRKLGQVIIADERTKAVTLEPHATFKGRLVDAEGNPIEGLFVNAVIPESESPEPKDGRAWGRQMHWLAGAETDADGRFSFDHILPGVKYEIRVSNKSLASHKKIKPNEVVDFGDLRVANDDDDEAAANEPNTKRPSRPKPATFRIAGRVFGPSGKPLAGAKLFFTPREGATEQDLRVRDIADESGKFSFSVPLSELDRISEQRRAPWSHPRVTARFDGFGPDWQYVVKPDANEDLTLRLVRDDVPIRGRIVTLEGQPVRNATIHVLRIEASPENNLQGWLNALANAGELWADGTFKLTKTLQQDVSGLPAQVRMDEQGRFQLSGLGRERVVGLRVEGPTIETRMFSVMTRKANDVSVPLDKEQTALGTFVCYGTGFSHAAAPSRPIAGRVLDAKSGEPIPGVTVYCNKRAGNDLHGRYHPEVVTGADGKFLLAGLPKGVDNKIQFVPPDGLRYLPTMRMFDTSDGLDLLVADVTMNPGDLIRGRVTDKSTGKPVAGARVEYFALRNNNVATYPGFRDSEDITTTTDAGGYYQIFGLPGRGLVAIRAASNEFAGGQMIDVVEKDYRTNSAISERLFRTHPSTCLASQHHTVAVVQAKESAETVRDVALERGHVVTVHVIGPNGQPLSGIEVNRKGVEACQYYGGEVEIESDEFKVWGLTAKQPRTLFIRHPSRDLAASRIVRHDDESPLVIRLEPAGEIVGRLLEDGKPAAFVEFRGALANRQTQQDDWLRITSDASGRFRIPGLVAGKGYRLRRLSRVDDGYVLLPRESRVPVNLVVDSGKTLDLGDVQVE